jgi:hypothetical protein
VVVVIVDEVEAGGEVVGVVVVVQKAGIGAKQRKVVLVCVNTDRNRWLR